MHYVSHIRLIIDMKQKHILSSINHLEISKSVDIHTMDISIISIVGFLIMIDILDLDNP